MGARSRHARNHKMQIPSHPKASYSHVGFSLLFAFVRFSYQIEVHSAEHSRTEQDSRDTSEDIREQEQAKSEVTLTLFSENP